MNKFYLHIDSAKDINKKVWCLQLKWNEQFITKRCDGLGWRVVLTLFIIFSTIIIKKIIGRIKMLYIPYNRYQCEYCGTYITVIYSRKGSYLPVELDKNGPVYRNDKFDKLKHISHLKHCPPMQQIWQKN